MLRAELTGAVGPLAIRVSLDVPARPVALVGPNGAGKSTLLSMLLGLWPASGTVTLGSEVLLDTARRIDVPVERRRMGYVPQGDGLFPHLSALENVSFALRYGEPGASARARREHARALLAEVDASGIEKQRPAMLSGGERQRVALARALAIRPSALLLDEPLSSVDVVARQKLRSSLRALFERWALPVLVVTHDVEDAEALADSAVVLEAGRTVQAGTLTALRESPASPFVAQLLRARA